MTELDISAPEFDDLNWFRLRKKIRGALRSIQYAKKRNKQNQDLIKLFNSLGCKRLLLCKLIKDITYMFGVDKRFSECYSFYNPAKIFKFILAARTTIDTRGFYGFFQF